MKFDFIKKKYIWFTISLIVFSFGVYSIVSTGLNLGIDFTGGTLIIIRYPENTPELADFREKVAMEKTEITVIDDQDFIIKTIALTAEQRIDLFSRLEENFGKHQLLEVDTIGPSIGEELKGKSLLILLITFSALLLYITIRFEVWYAIAAIIALIHDGLITVGIASYLKLDINTAFIAAILTILGYSINDTIVIFDRIRENSKKKSADIAKIANDSIWQTLGRSINTVITTLFVVVSLYLWGGSTLKQFALVLIIGISAGAYSSIFIASPVYVLLKEIISKKQ